MPYSFVLLSVSTLLLLSACQYRSDTDIGPDWETYKVQFVSPEGRVIDTGNENVSHSEGQGYGLLLAVKAHDQNTFKQIWQWTQANLQVRPADKLFIWRRREGRALADEDTNNATDGDMIIAWALLEAAHQWQQDEYAKAAAAIINDIKKSLIVPWHDMSVILPGNFGFVKEGYIIVNLSYWVYPALQTFAGFDKDPVWEKLIADGRVLLQKARFGRWQLPPDWLELRSDQTLQPAKTARFGYDAIRVPLYWIMAGLEPELLTTFCDYWDFYQRYTPAWIALNENTMDSYGASKGSQAVKNLTLLAQKRNTSARLGVIEESDDYYSATLLLLSKIGYRKLTG